MVLSAAYERLAMSNPIPVWKNDLACQLLCLDSAALVVVHIHRHNMRNQLGQWRTVQASQSQCAGDNCILVSFRQVSARDYDFSKEHRRVWAVLAWLCLSSLLMTRDNPRWSHDVNVVFQSSAVLGKVDIVGDDVRVAGNVIDRTIFSSGNKGGAVFGQEVDVLLASRQQLELCVL